MKERKQKSIYPPENLLTKSAVSKRAKKLKHLYKNRIKKQPGRRPDDASFIFLAAYLLFKEKYPQRREIHYSLRLWFDNNFPQYDFYPKKLNEWKRRGPFKEMMWEGSWDDIRTAQKICDKLKRKKELDQRRDIMRPHSISKKELEDLRPLILSQNTNNKKTKNKFIFTESKS